MAPALLWWLALVGLGPWTGDALLRSIVNRVAQPEAEAAAAPAAPRKFCQNWFNGRAPNCIQTGLTRVHQALEDENCFAALQDPGSAHMVGEKIRKLKDSTPFVFLRGTAALFYYDMFCEDRTFIAIQSNPHLFVVSNGDCHPENFGNTLLANGNLVFGVNDFDQAFRAPFTWDLKRGAVAFILACGDYGFPLDTCKKAVDSWLNGYQDVVSGNCTFRHDDLLVEGSAYLRKPKARMVKATMEMIRNKFDRNGGHRKWLGKKVDMQRLRFKAGANLKPLPASRIPEFQDVIFRYLWSGVSALVLYPKGHQFWKVLDVAQKLRSGTGSWGLDRYWILINGDNNEPRILSMKQVVTGVMEKYLNQHLTDYNQMYRVMSMMKSAQGYENLFFGVVSFEGRYYFIMEQSPFKSSVTVGDLKEPEFVDYAFVTGRAQAMLHISASCSSADCPMEDEANVDHQACREVAAEFTKEPLLHRSIAETSFQSAVRHAHYHKLLKEAFVLCPWLEKDPVMFLSHDVVGKCENA
eukprot:EG_transcript_9601